MFLFFVKLAIQLSIYNFVLYFGILILCSSETCAFILIKFSNGSLDFFVFVPIDSIPNQKPFWFDQGNDTCVCQK